MVQDVDETVGRVSDELERLGLTDNTILIFSSDNGPHLGGGHDTELFDSNGILRGHKRDLYEGGIRVPFIARWPGPIEAGSTSDHVSAMWDLMPTFCEIAGTIPPEGIDGISFLPALLIAKDKRNMITSIGNSMNRVANRLSSKVIGRQSRPTSGMRNLSCSNSST